MTRYNEPTAVAITLLSHRDEYYADLPERYRVHGSYSVVMMARYLDHLLAAYMEADTYNDPVAAKFCAAVGNVADVDTLQVAKFLVEGG